MAVPVTVPRLGEEMRSAILIQFLVPEGGTVTRGQPLYELDTDKVTQEVEAEAHVVVLRIDASEGGKYEVGAGVAWIGEQGEERPSPACPCTGSAPRTAHRCWRCTASPDTADATGRWPSEGCRSGAGWLSTCAGTGSPTGVLHGRRSSTSPTSWRRW